MQRKKISYNDIFTVLSSMGMKELIELYYNRLMVNKTDWSSLGTSFNKLNNFLDELDSFIILSDVPTLTYPYVSNGCKNILGHEASDLIKNGAEFLTDISCPADRGVSFKYVRYFKKHQNNCAPDQNTNYIYSTTTRFYHKSGYFKWFLTNFQFMFYDKQNKPLLTVVILTDINHFKPDDTLSLVINKCSQNGNEHTEYYDRKMPAGMDYLSKTDIDILKLLAEGHNNTAIAKELSFSESTIKDYRKKMLQKTWCSNTTELIYHALRNNLIE